MDGLRRDRYLDLWWVDCTRCKGSVTTRDQGQTDAETVKVAQEAGYVLTPDGWVCPHHERT